MVSDLRKHRKERETHFLSLLSACTVLFNLTQYLTESAQRRKDFFWLMF